MSGGLVSFGDYIFKSLGRYSTNFANQQSQLVRLAGTDGGFDLYGDAVAPAPIGQVTQTFMLMADSREEMDEERDSVRAMQAYGTAKLIYQPTNPADPQRWTWARLLLVNMPEDKRRNTDLWQTVVAIFQCAEPVWWVDTYVGWTWGDGWKWGDPGHIWGGNGFYIHSFGSDTTAIVPNGGNTISIPHIVVETLPGQSFQNVTIQRLEGLMPIEQFLYSNLFNPGDVLDINGRPQAVTFNGSSDWDNVDYDNPAFINLLPGNNSIRIILEDSGLSAPAIAYDAGDNELDGAYNNVVVGGGKGTYNASTSYTDIYSAALAAWIDVGELTIVSRVKVSGAGVWTDGAERKICRFRGNTVADQIFLGKSAINNMYIGYQSSAGGSLNTKAKTGINPTDSFTFGMTVSIDGDAMEGFYNGVSFGSKDTLNEFVGPLFSTRCLIGTQTPSLSLWDGDISDFILAKQVADATQMATLNTKLAAGTLENVDLDTIFGVGNWAWWGMNEGTQAAKVSLFYRDSYR